MDIDASVEFVQSGMKSRVIRANSARREEVMRVAAELGFLSDKTESVGARINPKLLERAKSLTGANSTSNLIELALATLVAEMDGFPDASVKLFGSVDKDLNLEF